MNLLDLFPSPEIIDSDHLNRREFSLVFFGDTRVNRTEIMLRYELLSRYAI